MFITDFLRRRLLCCPQCGADVTADGRRFRKIRTIATGGFSVVYLVQEVGGAGGRYALKQMVCHSGRELRRAELEIELHRRLIDVPQVLRLEAAEVASAHGGDQQASRSLVYKVGEDGAVSESTEVYLIFPYCKRGNLYDELCRRKATKSYVKEDRVLKLFEGVCTAVRHFHELQPPYAHRDIKPHNVLMGDAGEPLLMDLGSSALARQSFASRSSAAAAQDDAAEQCTMCYRAPELFAVNEGDCVDEKCDVWSLGCLLYAMCFFESPFDNVYERGDSVPLAVQSRVTVPDESPYSDEMHALIEAMLEVEPHRRPSVADVIASVTRLGAGITNVCI